MDEREISLLSAHLAAEIARARRQLQERMLERGLKLEQGWRIREEMRTSMSGTVFVLRPVHLKLADPGLETTVSIGHDGRTL